MAVIAEELATHGLRPGEETAAEVNGQSVRVVGAIPGFRGAIYPHVFCSLETARRLNPEFRQPVASFVLARCRRPADVPVVTARLQAAYADMGVSPSGRFLTRTRRARC